MKEREERDGLTLVIDESMSRWTWRSVTVDGPIYRDPDDRIAAVVSTREGDGYSDLVKVPRLSCWTPDRTGLTRAEWEAFKLRADRAFDAFEQRFPSVAR
jgi:hypothetical protein